MFDKLLFDHIPKTGGKTVQSVLQKLLGINQCSATLNTTFSDAYSKFGRYQCVSGHIAFLPGSDVTGCSLFTVLRNPVDRIISQYFFAHTVSQDNGDYFDKKCRQLSFEDFFFSEDEIIQKTISNPLIRHFYPLGVTGIVTVSQEEQLSAAKRALEERYFFVGLTERMDESMDLLCWHLGLTPIAAVPRINVTNAKLPTATDFSLVRQHLIEINQFDLELYEFAINLYDEKRRAVLAASACAKSNQRTQLTDTRLDSNDLGSIGLVVNQGYHLNYGNHKVEWIECIVSGCLFPGSVFLAGEVALFQFRFRVNEDIDDLTMGLSIHDDNGNLVFGTNTRQSGYLLKSKKAQVCSVEMRMRIDLAPGNYRVAASLHPGVEFLQECYHYTDRLGSFEVAGNWGSHFEGMYKLYPDWGFKDVDFTENNNARFVRLAKYVRPLTDFNASLSILDEIHELSVLEAISIKIELVNTGHQCWLAYGKKPVRVSYHWLDSREGVVVQDGERTLLPRDLPPGESISMWAKIVAPPSPGAYLLQVTLVQEFVGWFDENGFRPPELMVKVIT